MNRRLALAAVVILATVAGCANDDGGEPGNNRITRIDGPATVDDDAGADQDGAPAGAIESVTGRAPAVTPGS